MDSHQLTAVMQPTKVDLTIARWFPKWGAKRMASRREFAYEAAINTRLRSSATRLQGPEDYSVMPERLQLIRQVRDLECNFGLWQSIIDKLALYAFGRIRYRPHTGEKSADDAYGEFLAEEFNNIDLSGRHSLTEMVVLSFKSMLRDGDDGLKWQKNSEGTLKLVGIEGDRIGGTFMQSAAENYFQGITVDLATGAPLTYMVFKRTKANSYIDPVEIPARDFIHVFDPRRFDQYRGITPFAPIINEARDWKEAMEACRIGTKFENMHAAVGYTESGLPINDPASFITNGETNSQGVALNEQELKAGLIQWAPSNSRIDFMKSDRPSGTFQTYMESLIRLQGMALNLPFGFLYNLSGLGGPSARMDSQQAHRVIQNHQCNMVSRALNRIKDTKLMEGFARGKIKFTPTWRKGNWDFPPAISIDVGRDSKAAIEEMTHGMLSKDAWFAETGESAEEQDEIIAQEADRTIKRAQKLATDNGIELEMALNLIEIRTPNGWQTANQGGGGGEEDAGSSEGGGEGGKSEMARERVTRRLHRARALPRLLSGLSARRRRLESESDPLKWMKTEAEARKRDFTVPEKTGPEIVVNVSPAAAPNVTIAEGAIKFDARSDQKKYVVSRDADGKIKTLASKYTVERDERGWVKSLLKNGN